MCQKTDSSRITIYPQTDSVEIALYSSSCSLQYENTIANYDTAKTTALPLLSTMTLPQEKRNSLSEAISRGVRTFYECVIWDEYDGTVYECVIWGEEKEVDSDDEDTIYDDRDIYFDDHLRCSEDTVPTILGASEIDLRDGNYILTRPLMQELRSHMPYCTRQDNFLLKYSLVRDGASLSTLLSKVYHSTRTVIAIETLDGDVFGAFTSSPWRNYGSQYYGSGESFLWRRSQDDEEGTDVFPWACGGYHKIQMVNSERLVIGGHEDKSDEEQLMIVENMSCVSSNSSGNLGFGIALNSDLSRGSTSCCMTFLSPCLLSAESLAGKQTGVFYVANIEVWAMTSTDCVVQAERLERARSFIYEHAGYVHS